MLFLDVIIGCIIGFLLGLVPGIHINIIAYTFAITGFLAVFPNHFYFFLSIALAQLISSFIPSTVFGVPNDQTIMCIFPAQRFFIKGMAKQAIYLCMIGSFFGLIFSIVFLPLLYLLFISLFNFNLFIAIAIFLVLFIFVISEKTILSKLTVLSIIIFSGVLGIFTLKFNFFVREPLIVCVAGLFAFPMLIKSIFEDQVNVRQNKKTTNINLKKYIPSSIFGVLSSMFIILIPSFSSSQAATIISKLKRKLPPTEYLITFSSIAVSSLIFSFFLAINFSKPRLGYIAVLLQHNLIQPQTNIFLFILVTIIVISLSIFLTLTFLNKIIDFLNNHNLKIINIIILFISLILILFISGIKSIPLLLLSISIGFLPIFYNKTRIILMSYIMIPTLLFYI